MPPKKVIKKTKISNVKAEASAVKTVVNVRVGDQNTRAKTVKRRRTVAGAGAGLGIFNRPLPLATQSLSISQPAFMTNEYNELLKALATERKERMSMAPPLAPNSTPLTANIQTNELLDRPIPRNPMIPIAQAFAVAQEATVEKDFADDPLTNENMFVGSSRLAEKLSQKLPVTNFDYNDMESYDSESNRNQEDLVSEAVSSKAKGKTTPSGTKYEEVSKVYDGYINYLKDVNKRYGINEPPKARRDFNSQIAIKKEIRRIQDLVLSI